MGATSVVAEPSAHDRHTPHHLVILAHGLADTHHAWDRCIAELRRLPNASGYLFHSSAVNGRFRTHDGFDRCGGRLAEEIRGLLAEHPQLTQLSVFGHSMGGMIARYALGVLFRPEDGTICGLLPRHFITLATPHLGLTVDEGPAQVPFVAWSGRIPLLGPGIKRALQSVAHAVARCAFRGTGRHFLALDGSPGEAPLLMRLTMDEPDKGHYFFSGLRAFASRACYGNVGRDHWVSWENSTVRGTDDLPHIPQDVVRAGKGVVRADPPEAGFGPGRAPPPPPPLSSPPPCPSGQDARAELAAAAAAAAAAVLASGSPTAVPGSSPAAGAEAGGTIPVPHTPAGPDVGLSAEALREAAHHPPRVPPHAPPSGASAGEGSPPPSVTDATAAAAAPAEAADGGRGAEVDDAAEVDDTALELAVEQAWETPQQVVAFALARLQLLPWRRVDVSFAGASLGTAHNNIQATRWTNLVGRGVLRHLREHLQAVEELAASRAGEAAQAGEARES